VSAASGAGKDAAGHAEETGRKPRMIGDVEEDEPGHGGDIRLKFWSGKLMKRRKGNPASRKTGNGAQETHA
jgi:hypothetical protein